MILVNSKLILGTVQFGMDYGINNPNGKLQIKEVNAILDLARENGINYLDTASSYGTAEQAIGNYIQTLGFNPFSIISKLVYSEHLPVSAMMQNSLEQLYVDAIDVMMLHRFQDLQKYPEILMELKKHKEAGLIGRIGISVYSNEEVIQLLDYDEIELIQLPFNLLDNTQRREEVLMKAKENDKTIHTRSVFLQGPFFKPFDEYPEKLKSLIPYMKKVKGIASDANVPLIGLALQYAISREFIDGVLCGVDSQNQLVENINALSYDIDEEIFHAIDDINVLEVDLLNPVTWSR